MKVIQKKVCMLGDFAVGKTSLVKRFVEGRFDDKYLSTIGVKISRRNVEHADNEISLIVWDLAGGDEFIRTNSGYLRGAAGALIVCDLTRPQTLRAAEQYAYQIRRLNPQAGIVLVGNKCDLVEERLITDEDLATMGGLHNRFDYFLTSAKTGIHVEDAFTKLAHLILTDDE